MVCLYRAWNETLATDLVICICSISQTVRSCDDSLVALTSPVDKSTAAISLIGTPPSSRDRPAKSSASSVPTQKKKKKKKKKERERETVCVSERERE